jgi:membrane peptidoglycan carboxypeptidase
VPLFDKRVLRARLGATDGTPPLQALLTTILAGGVVVGVFLAALLASGGILIGAQDFTNDIGPLRDLAQRSTVYDAQGNVIAVLGTLNREEVRLREVPKILRNAVIAVEDKTFWTNDGVDFNAVLRAFLKNVTSGEIEQGGSTITQQLVKNRILTPKRDLNRKVREVILALRLSGQFTKREILEQYLNTVYFGQGSYGVKAAAERFFLKPGPYYPIPTELSELTIGEAALLAGLIANPEGDNPFASPGRALARRAFALGRMVEQRYITRGQANAANLEPLPTIKPEAELRPRTSWAEEVQDRLIHDPVYKVLGATPALRRTRVLTGGLKIHATLDPALQRIAQTSMNAILPEKPGFTGALVAIEPRTGEVRAMVAGPGFEQSQYNIATSYPGRQAGSTWKIMTLATALENGFSPKDTVSGSSPCSFGIWGKTRNAERGGGRQTLRSATAHSVNCAFARVELAVGLDKVIATAHKMGITQKTLKPILTLTLGTIESTPLEMATVTATIANGGIHHAPLFVNKITLGDGTVVFDAEKDAEGDRAISADTAACETDMLRGVITGGTGTAARLSRNRPVAGKTGTTDSKADANFLGFTPQLAVFIWHGNALAQVPGAGFGGQIPARIFKSFMESAMLFQPLTPFPAPGPSCDRLGAYITDKGRGLPTRTNVPATAEVPPEAPTAPPAAGQPTPQPLLPSAPTIP